MYKRYLLSLALLASTMTVNAYEGGLDVEVVNGVKRDLKGLLEGTHMMKCNGKYYLFMISWVTVCLSLIMRRKHQEVMSM